MGFGITDRFYLGRSNLIGKRALKFFVSIAVAVLCSSVSYAQDQAAANTAIASSPSNDEGGSSKQGQVIGQTAPGPRQPKSTVIAIVGDDVITSFDLTQRIKLMLISAARAVTPELLAQLEAQALKDLIEERLKLKEAERFEAMPDKKEIESELVTMAGRSGLTPEQLEKSLAADDISMNGLRSQIAANISWPRIVRGRYGSRVRITDEEVESTMERMREEAGAEQFLVSEICIPVPSPEQAQAYYEGGLQLIEQMRKGVPFAVVAQQFSACTSAAAGGDLGWVRAGQLPTELDSAIKDLPLGSVTAPIPSDGAFMILAVRDKREARVQSEKTYTLAYASAPVELGRAAARKAIEKIATASACGANIRQDLGPDVGIALIDSAKLSDLDQRFHAAIDGLDRGDLSPIIEADDYLHIAYVCELDEGLGIPSRKSIKDNLYARRLAKISQQYLRDVERKTMVDIRDSKRQRSGATAASTSETKAEGTALR
ncbi:MAG: peptidylprolyl isomerase [Pseudomonadota bacterium]